MEMAVGLQDVFAYNWGQTRKKPIAVISERFIRQHPIVPEKCLRYTSSLTK
jgi:uncharacterized membrane protein